MMITNARMNVCIVSKSMIHGS